MSIPISKKYEKIDITFKHAKYDKVIQSRYINIEGTKIHFVTNVTKM